MPKKLSLVQVTLNEDGAIPLLFGLDIMEGDERIHRTPLRRIIDPDGDINQNLDDIDTYVTAQGYSGVTDGMRQFVYALDAVCRENEVIETNRAAYVANKPPPMDAPPADEPEPELEEAEAPKGRKR